MKEMGKILGCLVGACALGLLVYHLAFEPVLDKFIPDGNYFSVSSTVVCK